MIQFLQDWDIGTSIIIDFRGNPDLGKTKLIEKLKWNMVLISQMKDGLIEFQPFESNRTVVGTI